MFSNVFLVKSKFFHSGTEKPKFVTEILSAITFAKWQILCNVSVIMYWISAFVGYNNHMTWIETFSSHVSIYCNTLSSDLV